MLNPSLELFFFFWAGGALCLILIQQAKTMTGNRWTVGGVDEGPKLVTGTKFQIPNVSSTPKLLGKKKKKYPEDREDQSLSVKPVAASAFPYLLSASALTAH